MNNVLFIGLNGYAGAGKDTVAKMLKIILSRDWESLDECKQYYFNTYTNPTQSATFNFNYDDKVVKCIAYADQLKVICSTIFGIPLQRFYMNKSNAWICLTDKFQYTEVKPNDENIITAEEFYYANYSTDTEIKWWMSLREILVYVGTYVLQQNINRNIFVNIIRNLINEEIRRNNHLKYAIITDNRFNHELNYIHEQNGITLSIVRDSIQQLDNIAEHDLDDIEDYDYVIDNSGSYDELFDTLWNMIHDNIEFQNITVDLYTRENVHNYLRLVSETETHYIYKLCTEHETQGMYKTNGDITVINPIGGPVIELYSEIDTLNGEVIVPQKIEMNQTFNKFLIYVAK